MDHVIKSHAEVRASSTSGNGLFATEAIPAGGLVLSIQRPLVGVLDLAHLGDSCSNCFLWPEGDVEKNSVSFTHAEVEKKGLQWAREKVQYMTEEGMPIVSVNACTGCKKVKYCSKNCQKQAWNREHKYICKSLKTYPPLPHAVRAARELAVLLIRDGVSSDRKKAAERMEKFELSTRDRDAESQQQFITMVAAVADILKREVPELPDPIGVSEDCVGKIVRNSLTLTTPTLEPIGLVFDPLLCTANHSCAPNAFVIMDGAYISFCALEPIPKGGEIFISYIDTSNPFPFRQVELLSRYAFVCRCKKCALGFNSPENTLLKPTTSDIAEKCRRINGAKLTEVPPTVALKYNTAFPPLSRLELHLTAMQGGLFEDLEKARSQKSPIDAIHSYRKLMGCCAGTNMFMVSRQPFAAAYAEIVPHLLETKAWEMAFLALVKVYFLIDPVLYPQPFHPVRVVHTYTLMRVMSQLRESMEDTEETEEEGMEGTEGTEGMAGLEEREGMEGMEGMEEREAKEETPSRQFFPNDMDFSVVIYKLLQELLGLVTKSHGFASRFEAVLRMMWQAYQEIPMDARLKWVSEDDGHSWGMVASYKDDRSLEIES